MKPYVSPWMDDELSMLREAVSRFVETEMLPHDARWRKQKHVDRETWRRVGEAGFLLLDVLDGLDTLQICTGYRIDGEVHEHPPLLPHRFSECEPVYESHPGWKEPTIGITDFSKLPGNARNYLARMEQLAGVPIDIVSTGPDRTETIVLRHPFD